MTSDGSDDQGAGTNPQEGAEQVSTDAGGDQPAPVDWDKVADVLRDTTGADLNAEFKKRSDAASAQTAEDVGKKAQKTYDPKIDALAKRLQETETALGTAKDSARLAEIASMPKEKQDAARELLKGEKSLRELSGMRTALFDAAKTVTAEKMVLDLAKRGITAEVEDFMECGTPDAMEAKAANLRAEEAERKTKETSEAGETKETKERQPPAVSQRAAPKKAATGGDTGQKPWEGLKGKGLGSMSDALRSMREADVTGE